MIIRLSLFVAFVLAASASAEALEFKGFALGGSVDQLRTRFPFLTCREEGCAYFLTTCSNLDSSCGHMADDYTIGDAPINWTVGADAGRVEWIMLTTGSRNFDALAAAL